MQLLELAESSLELASSYWTLRGSDIDHDDPTDWQGEDIYKRIHKLALSQKVKIKIAQNLPGKDLNKDTDDLAKVILNVNVTKNKIDAKSIYFTSHYSTIL